MVLLQCCSELSLRLSSIIPDRETVIGLLCHFGMIYARDLFFFLLLILFSCYMQSNRHTIILMQTSQYRATRTFMDFDSISQAMDGICGLYERKLKEINPAIRNLSYDISDLYNFIDGLADLSALVYLSLSSLPVSRSHTRIQMHSH
ncbi:enhancer of rudimentary homolog [Olea europaea subsp. europaea]|uniref:Enhancer of rudimentary homolog n=2 Tax=Olea europaea subsp. europaea TaxID=158383 RepID=A0A8S0S1M6_OLEEU|nr:enhancer of rudimentary homolog [Olea europaea subsp. europaea]